MNSDCQYLTEMLKPYQYSWRTNIMGKQQQMKPITITVKVFNEPSKEAIINTAKILKILGASTYSLFYVQDYRTMVFQ